MPAEPYIQIIVRNDDELTWEDSNSIVLAHGEPAAVFTVAVDSNGLPVRDGNNQYMTRKLKYSVVGDGVSTFVQLEPLWPVPKRAFNSAARGQPTNPVGRNMRDIVQNNVVLTYETFAEAIEAFMFPYAPPYFTYFNPGFPTLEVGMTLNVNGVQFSWDSANPDNVELGSVTITEVFAGVNNLLASGRGASGVFQSSGVPIRQGTAIGQVWAVYLAGQNTQNNQMPTASRSFSWEGQRALFTHPDAEWLIADFTAAAGDPASTFLASEAALVTLLNGKLDDTTLRNNGRSVLGNGAWGRQSIDGGPNGSRIYVLYPVPYRGGPAGMAWPLAAGAATDFKARYITLPRHGVPVPYCLIGYNTRWVLGADIQIDIN